MIRNIVIVGGGTAGWMTAAALSNSLCKERYNVKLIESDQIGTVGVGEASIPPLMFYNRALGINELDFIRATSGTFKLGIEFVNWRKQGHSYFHPFGESGTDLAGINFMQHWLRWKKLGKNVDLMSFNVECCAAREKKFMLTAMEKGPKSLPDVSYAYHFDATLYAKFLREYAERRGCERIEGKVVEVLQHNTTGYITSVCLENGNKVSGDFFVDCSGFRGLLIEETLKSGYHDWSHWLPVNSAIAAQTKTSGELLPYTRSIAKDAGWQWRIPLQHRVGNGYAYCNRFIEDDRAKESFIQDLDGDLLTEPKVLRFTTGSRKKSWIKNCVAIGLSSGFLEPLESTSIHLIQRSIHKLLAMFPTDEIEGRLVDRFNKEVSSEYSEVKDFLIAHYVINERDDTEFWRYLKSVELPESLREKLDTFKRRGEVYVNMQDCFREVSWFAVLNGQGLEPEGYHPIADSVPEDALQRQLTNIRSMVKRRLETMPSHRDFINAHCKSDLI